MAKKISDLPETTNIELDDIVWVDKFENGQLKSKRFKLLSIFSKLKTVFGSSLFGSGDIDSPKDGKAYGRKDGEWLQILENLEGLNTDDLEEGDDNKYFPTGAASKLETIEAGAQKNVQADWSETNQEADSFIQNKPNVLALGETSTSAYRGDRGKVAYDHSKQNTGNPHKVTLSNVLAQDSSTNGQSIELSGSDSIKQDESRLRFGSDVLFLEPKSRTSIGSGLVRAVNEVFEQHICAPEDYLIVAADRTDIHLSAPPNVPVIGVEFVIYSIGECNVYGDILGVPGELNLKPNECITLVYLSGNKWGIISKNF